VVGASAEASEEGEAGVGSGIVRITEDVDVDVDVDVDEFRCFWGDDGGVDEGCFESDFEKQVFPMMRFDDLWALLVCYLI
tara:strand:+ start:941 stop:1180 length:240 start_codon:yes stop_codon:yes gene_type:complete